MVNRDGVNASGETAGGYQWRVQSQPREVERGTLGRGQLHDLEVGVAWFDGSKRREIVLNSVVEAYVSDRR